MLNLFVILSNFTFHPSAHAMQLVWTPAKSFIYIYILLVSDSTGGCKKRQCSTPGNGKADGDLIKTISTMMWNWIHALILKQNMK